MTRKSAVMAYTSVCVLSIKRLKRIELKILNLKSYSAVHGMKTPPRINDNLFLDMKKTVAKHTVQRYESICLKIRRSR